MSVVNSSLPTHPKPNSNSSNTVRFRGFKKGSVMIKAISFQTDFENQRTRIEKGKTIKPLHESIKSMLGNPRYRSVTQGTIKDVP